MTDYRFVADAATVDRPTLIVMLSGWIDAAETSQRTMETLIDECNGDLLVEFDDDTFIDYRARRPIMSLRDSLNAELSWSSIKLYAGRDLQGAHVLLLSGPEPDMYWHRFADQIGGLALVLGV